MNIFQIVPFLLFFTLSHLISTDVTCSNYTKCKDCLQDLICEWCDDTVDGEVVQGCYPSNTSKCGNIVYAASECSENLYNEISIILVFLILTFIAVMVFIAVFSMLNMCFPTRPHTDLPIHNTSS